MMILTPWGGRCLVRQLTNGRKELSLSRFKTLATGFGATALASFVLAAAPAVASSPMTVSFAASPGSSAGWTHNHHAFKLHVAGNASTAFAVVKVHHFPSALPHTAPSFTASFYQSGTPRWFIKFANGAYLEGYPTINAWDLHDPSYAYGTYAQMVAKLRTDSGGTLPNVRRVQIIADGSAPLPYTTKVSDVQYAGQNLTP
jgi:hypothetical protein